MLSGDLRLFWPGAVNGKAEFKRPEGTKTCHKHPKLAGPSELRGTCSGVMESGMLGRVPGSLCRDIS